MLHQNCDVLIYQAWQQKEERVLLCRVGRACLCTRTNVVARTVSTLAWKHAFTKSRLAIAEVSTEPIGATSGSARRSSMSLAITTDRRKRSDRLALFFGVQL